MTDTISRMGGKVIGGVQVFDLSLEVGNDGLTIPIHGTEIQGSGSAQIHLSKEDAQVLWTALKIWLHSLEVSP